MSDADLRSAYEFALAEAAEVDAGRSSVLVLGPIEPNYSHCNVRVQTSNGFTFEFFNDGGSFDYFEWAQWGKHPNITRIDSFPNQHHRPYAYPPEHTIDDAPCECAVCRFSFYRPPDDRRWGVKP